jgi:hypothetical protein
MFFSNRPPLEILQNVLAQKKISLAELRRLLGQGNVPVNGFYADGQTPLTALFARHLREDAASTPEHFLHAMRALRDAGASINQPDQRGLSPFSFCLALIPRNYQGTPHYDAMSFMGGTTMNNPCLPWVLDGEEVDAVIDPFVLHEHWAWTLGRLAHYPSVDAANPWNFTPVWKDAPLPPEGVWELPLARLSSSGSIDVVEGKDANVLRAFLFAKVHAWPLPMKVPGAHGFRDPQGHTLLSRAVLDNDVQGVDCCLQDGMDPAAPLPGGQTLMDLCGDNAHPLIVQRFFELSLDTASPDAQTGPRPRL